MRENKRFMELLEESESRYAQREEVRTKNEEYIRNGEIEKANSEEQFANRLGRLDIDSDTYETLAGGAFESAGGAKAIIDDETVSAFERILGTNNLLGINYLELGLFRARPVARIEINDTMGFAGHGTGFMVSPRLMMTNNHVLHNKPTAARSRCEFDFQLSMDGMPRRSLFFAFEPDEFFLTNRALDFTLVAVKTPNEAGQNLSGYGHIPLIGESGKVVIGEMINIIQHPGGQMKQVTLHENELIDIVDDFLHYKSDTMRGSSGSPVFNDQWEAIALHHSGVPQRNEEGKVLSKSGDVWTPLMGNDQIMWLANEGVRVSQLVAYLRGQREALEPSEQALLDEVLVDSPSTGDVLTIGQPASGALPTFSGIPQSTRVTQPAIETSGDGDLAQLKTEALNMLAESAERTYYDAEQDQRDREAYYAGIRGIRPDPPAAASISFTADDGRTLKLSIGEASANGGAGTVDFEQLRDLVRDTHARTPKYKPSQHVYPWVDLHEDGMLRSIYSGKTYDPRVFIEADIETESRLQGQMEAFMVLQETEPSAAMLETMEAFFEASLPYNCEHVVPQSWFGRREPMRGDLHHLFACESGCNSFRSNIPYFDFDDFGEATRSECGKRLDTRFEPESGKGTVARAVMYFLLRYPGQIDDNNSEFERERLPMLLKWHRDFPVDEYERHRNMAIFLAQGNRNPFIDFPEWAEKVDFSKGLG
jgi:endonuclease I/V8-like Glu-specific endopeptidase